MHCTTFKSPCEPDNGIYNKMKTNWNNNILLQEKFQTNKTDI